MKQEPLVYQVFRNTFQRFAVVEYPSGLPIRITHKSKVSTDATKPTPFETICSAKFFTGSQTQRRQKTSQHLSDTAQNSPAPRHFATEKNQASHFLSRQCRF